jgi:hypothetical protein
MSGPGMATASWLRSAPATVVDDIVAGQAWRAMDTQFHLNLPQMRPAPITLDSPAERDAAHQDFNTRLCTPARL